MRILVIGATGYVGRHVAAALTAALGAGTAVCWSLPDATAALGPLADLFTRDQDVSATTTRTTLGWHPRHRAILTELPPAT